MNKLKEANRNSFPAQRWVWEVYEVPCQEMSYGTKAVAGVIALCAWGEKDKSNPGYESISVALGGASRATISKAIKELQERGFIAVSKKATKAGLHNEYRLTFPNSLDTKHIKGLDTEHIESNSSVWEVNEFSLSTQSVHTGELEALKEAPSKSLTYTEVEEETPSSGLLPDSLARVEPVVNTKYPEPPSGLQKHFDRQARINAEILAEYGGAE